jgi:multidrug efflux pump subunit AcrA (membrane-fusion protein)
MSVDPAPAEDFEAKQAAVKAQIAKLQAQLLDTKLTIFKRYRALFALRNINTPDAVLVRNFTKFPYLESFSQQTAISNSK